MLIMSGQGHDIDLRKCPAHEGLQILVYTTHKMVGFLYIYIIHSSFLLLGERGLM